MKTHSFLDDAGMYSTMSMISGTERMYKPPRIRIWNMKYRILGYFFAYSIDLMHPTKNITIVMALKNTKRYEGMVSYIWYLSCAPSVILFSRVKITVMSPIMHTILLIKYKST